MSGYFIFGDVDSRTYHVNVFDSETDSAPARVYERYEVAGRDGDLFIDQKRFENVQAKYWGVIYSDYDENLKNFRAALRSQIGYKRLTDSIHAGEFYEACFIERLEVETAMGRRMGKFEIVFDRKPQRWLTSGEQPTALSASGTITNPTRFPSNPLLRVYGTGKMFIGSYGISVNSNSNYTDIDCFTQEAYSGATSKNANVTFHGTGKPSLEPGDNNITIPNTMTNVQFTPRWYTI